MATGRVNVGGGSGGASLNIYTQLNEPSRKEGLWLQTTGKFKAINFETDVFMGGEYVPELGFQLNTGRRGNIIAATEEYLYLFTNNFTRRYSFATQTWTELEKAPRAGAGVSGSAVLIENKIYVFNYTTSHTTTYIDVYDITNNTWELGTFNLGGNNYNFTSSIHKYGDNLYTITEASSGSLRITKYSLLDGTYEVLANRSTNGNGTYVGGGNKIFIISRLTSGNVSEYFDLDTYEFIPITSPSKRILGAKGVLIGTKLHIFGGDLTVNELNIFDTLSGTWSVGAPMPNPHTQHGIYAVSEKVYVAGGIVSTGGAATNVVDVYSLEGKQFPEGELVIQHAGSIVGDYATQFFTSKIPIKNKRLLSYFDNAWLFKGGRLQEYPTYYGDGEKWIKFKN